jgi:hypothetical protein
VIVKKKEERVFLNSQKVNKEINILAAMACPQEGPVLHHERILVQDANFAKYFARS